MNLRSSIGLLGLFLAMFWVFGLMLSLERGKADESLVLPTLSASSDNYEIDSVVVERTAKGKDAEEFRFTRKDDNWTLQQGSQAIKVETFRIRDLIREVREARRDIDASVPDDPGSYGLRPPQATITLVGTRKKKAALDEPKGEKKEEKAKEEAGPQREWKLFVGNDSVDKKYVYVSTSDRPGRVFAVAKSSLGGVFFKSANDLRSKRLFDFSEPTVQSFVLKQGAGELEAKKSDVGNWLIAKPDLGYADYEGPPVPKEAPPGAKAPEGGIKGLLGAIGNIRVDSEDDFVPPAPDALKRHELEAGKESMRIQVFSGDAKKPTEETLLVGRAEKDYRYARLATDEGVFKIRVKSLEPVQEAIAAPAKLRNVDLAPVAIKEADALVLRDGKDEAKLLKQVEWQIELNDRPRVAARPKSVDSLLDALQGKRDIVAFHDGADGAKVDKELGLDSPAVTVSLYLKGLEDAKEAKDRAPGLKKDAKADVVWQFAAVKGERASVKRTMADGRVSRFEVGKAALERIVPREGLLAYAEPHLSERSPADVTRIEIDRSGKALTLEKEKDRWLLKQADGAAGTVADPEKVLTLLKTFTRVPVSRWVKKLDAKEDVTSFGLDKPATTVTLTIKKDDLSPQALGSALGVLGGVSSNPGLVAVGAAWANVKAAPGEKVVYVFGNVSKEDSEAVYAQRVGDERLALVAQQALQTAQSADLRDRSTILNPQVYADVSAIGLSASQPMSGLLASNPLLTGRLGRGDANQVKELHVNVRTPIELRSFRFARKDKSWVDQSGLTEFQLDDAKVTEAAELVAGLEVARLVQLTGGPGPDQKLNDKEASLKIDAILDDAAKVTLTVGATYEGHGYFAQASTWPGAVFLLSPERVQPLLRGADYFARPRVARAE